MSGVLLLVLRLALAVALYAFLGWALLLLWRELKRQGELMAVRQVPPITLRSQDEAGLPSYHFNIPQIAIGRDPLNDCCLDDSTVSASHARLSHHHGQWWIEDLGSTNGTFLNQESVSMPLVVAQGDQLRFGQVTLEVSIGANQTEPGTVRISV
jgi:pSer/pThr/pTyr-binding forkhead associated (FHA) protein